MLKNNKIIHMNNTDNNWKDRKLGALWKRASKDGTKKFYTGNIEIDGQKIDLVIFPTKNKENPNAPDLQIYRSEDRPQSAKPKTAQNTNYNSAKQTGSNPTWKKNTYPPRQQTQPQQTNVDDPNDPTL